ncbi:MAG: hypothetical protein H0W36_04800 [Gemmatimonadetes bacterium]|nr:hypothetical protein [Gemmatimonadota bacterium]
MDEDVRVDDEQELLSLHGFIQGIPIVDIDEMPAAVEGWQRPKLDRLLLGSKEETESGFHQLGHRLALASSLLLEPDHHAVIDAEGRLHMD